MHACCTTIYTDSRNMYQNTASTYIQQQEPPKSAMLLSSFYYSDKNNNVNKLYRKRKINDMYVLEEH